MRKLFFVLSLVFSTVTLFAQPGPGAGRGAGGQMPTGRFYGKVVDSKTGKPIEYASVQLIQSKMDTATKNGKKP